MALLMKIFSVHFDSYLKFVDNFEIYIFHFPFRYNEKDYFRIFELRLFLLEKIMLM